MDTMGRIHCLLNVLGMVLLLALLTGCGSGSYYGGSGAYYHRNSWDYDRYYRSRVNYNYHRTAVRRSTRPVSGTRPVRVRRR